jgi:hypothetical protein
MAEIGKTKAAAAGVCEVSIFYETEF